MVYNTNIVHFLFFLCIISHHIFLQKQMSDIQLPKCSAQTCAEIFNALYLFVSNGYNKETIRR